MRTAFLCKQPSSIIAHASCCTLILTCKPYARILATRAERIHSSNTPEHLDVRRCVANDTGLVILAAVAPSGLASMVEFRTDSDFANWIPSQTGLQERPRTKRSEDLRRAVEEAADGNIPGMLDAQTSRRIQKVHLHHRTIRTQNWGIYFLDHPGDAGCFGSRRALP